MPRGSAAPEPLSIGAGVRGRCLAAAGLLPCLDEAHLPWHQGRDAPSASLSGRGPAPAPAELSLTFPASCSARGVREPALLPLPAATPPRCRPRRCLPMAVGRGSLCLVSLHPAPCCSPGAGGGQHPLPGRAGVQGPRARLWLPARLGNSFLPKSVCRRCPSTVKRLSQTHTLRLGCV